GDPPPRQLTTRQRICANRKRKTTQPVQAMTRTIITAALTGVLSTRDQCPAIPYTPREIGEEAARAAQEGAAIVHIHARTPEGGPDWSVETFAQIYTEVRARSDVIVNFSTGAVGVPAEQRIAHIRELKPEMAAR